MPKRIILALVFFSILSSCETEELQTSSQHTKNQSITAKQKKQKRRKRRKRRRAKACQPPQNIVIKNQQRNLVELVWNQNTLYNDSSYWQITYKMKNQESRHNLILISCTNKITLDNLKETSTYQVSIRKNCRKGGFTDWATIDIITL